MKKIKFENIFAILVLLGLILFLGAFLFVGVSPVLIACAVFAVAAGIVIRLLLGRDGKKKQIVKVCYGIVGIIAVCGFLCTTILLNTAAGAPLASGNIQNEYGESLWIEASSSKDQTRSSVNISSDKISVYVRCTHTEGDCNTYNCSPDTVTVRIYNNNSNRIDFTISVSGAETGNVNNVDDFLEGNTYRDYTFSLTECRSADASNMVEQPGTITFTGISLEKSGNKVETTFLSGTNGSYKVTYTDEDENKQTLEIEENRAIDQSSLISYTLTAPSPSTGYVFYGWMSQNGGLLSNQSTYTYYPKEGDPDFLWPVFRVEAGPVFYIKDESPRIIYGTLNEALTAAENGTSKEVVVYEGGTLPAGNYTIPSGVTLVVPFDEFGTSSQDEAASYADINLNDATIKAQYKPTPYQDLILASQAHITVESNAAICVSGRNSITQRCNGAPYGNLGYITMNKNSSITIKDGANLYVWGYIRHADTDNEGTVIVHPGGTVYESFQTPDWRGGSSMSSLVGNKYGVFPLSQYYVQSIEVELKIYAGATEKLCGASNLDGSTQLFKPEFIGSNGMFRLAYADGRPITEQGYIIKNYDESKDRLIIDVYGDVEVSDMTLDVVLSGSRVTSINTASYVLPLNSNITLNFHTGSTTINQNIALLSGSKVTIAADAEVIVESNVFVYDADQWGTYAYNAGTAATYRPLICVSTGSSGPRGRNPGCTTDAEIVIDGTLDATGGGIYTTKTGANIHGAGDLLLGEFDTNTKTYQITFEKAIIGYSHDYPQIELSQGVMVKNPNKVNAEDPEYITLTDKGVYDMSGQTTDASGNWVCAHIDVNPADTTCDLCGVTVCASHNPVYVKTVAPTCTEGGYDLWKCNACNTEEHRELTKALGHVTISTERQEPDCETPGLTAGSYCQRCEQTLEGREVIPALGHNEGDPVVTYSPAPTCTKGGEKTTTVSCSICGDQISSETVDVEPNGHTYNVTVTFSTEGTTYTVTLLCNQCEQEEGYTKSTSGDSTFEHIDGDCQNTGYTIYTAQGTYEGCSYNQSSQKFYDTDFGNHKPDVIEAKVPTCTEEGNNQYWQCTVCNEYFADEACTKETTVASQTIPKHALTLETVKAQSATCEGIGWNEYIACSECDYKEGYTEIPLTGHNYVGTVTVPATCIAEGTRTYVCQNDASHTYTETIEMSSHTLATVSASPATCDEPGWQEYQYCTYTGCTHTTKVEIPNTGHNYDKWVVTTAPTVTSEGLITRTCQNDPNHKDTFILPQLNTTDYDYSEEAATCESEGTGTYTYSTEDGQTLPFTVKISKLVHDLEDHAAQNPTCSEFGWEAYQTCIRDKCNYSTYVEISALGHNKVPHDAQAATCEGIGCNAYETCTRCDYTTYVEIPALGHNKVPHDAQAATCEGIGWDAYETCTRCDYTTYVEIPVLGHTPGDAATCTEAQICTVCEAEIAEATGHTFGEWVVTEQPNCDEKGKKQRECQNCNHSETGDVDALNHIDENRDYRCDRCEASLCGKNHNYKGTETVPTCTQDGYTTYVCENCHDSYIGDIVVTQGHTPGDAATCTEAQTCTKCPEVIVAALGHNKVSHEAQAATCTAIGWNAYETCTRCAFTTYVEIPALDHDTVDHDGQAATCTTPGWKAYQTCENCDYSTYEVINALGHDKILHTAKPATCEGIGWDAYETCNRQGCDYSTYVEIAALGHDKESHDAKAATCTEKGWNAYETCNRQGCDYSTYVEIAALGHDKESHDAKAATCTEKGWNAYETCARCDYTTYSEISALGHIKVNHTEKAATCTEIGWNAYETCNRQGCDYSTYVEIAALGHDKESHDAKAATCTEKGWNAYETCSRCDYTTYVEISALDHDTVDHDGQAATCTVDGWKAYQTCTRCDYTTYESISALGHDEIPHSAKPATCTAIGWNAYVTCSRCDYTTYSEIGKLEHTPDEPTEENRIEATCKADGSYDSVIYCAGCNTELERTQVVLEKISHTPGNPVRFTLREATCIETGLVQDVTYCTTCRTEIDRSDVLPTGTTKHIGSTTVENVIPATCTDAGSYDEKFTCRVCGFTKTEEDKIIEMLSHTPGQAVRENEYAPTCTESGSYESVVYCVICSNQISREEFEIPTIAHQYVTEIKSERVEATCTVDGSYVMQCICGATETRPIYALGHNYEVVYVKAPSCEDDGILTLECSACKHSFTMPDPDNPAIKHIDEDENGNCDNCGEEMCDYELIYDLQWSDDYLTCTITATANCGYANHNHNKISMATVENLRLTVEVLEPATCTTPGLAKHTAIFWDSWLKQYGEVIEITEEVVISALNHPNMQSVDDAKAPTCQAAGYEAYEYCPDCDYTTYVEIPATNHSYADGVVTDPTCTTPGYTTYTCTVCGHSYTGNETQAAHNYTQINCWNEWEVWDECATCDGRVNVRARTYNVTIVDYWGNETVRENMTYGQYLWLNYSVSNVLEFDYPGWMIEDSNGDMRLVQWYEVWETFKEYSITDHTTTELRVYEATVATKVKPGAILMSVSYDNATSDKTMTVDLFIFVDSLGDNYKPIVKLGNNPAHLELKQIDESLNLYLVTIELSSYQITQGGENVQITIDYPGVAVNDPDKTIDSLLIVYQSALENYLKEIGKNASSDAQEAAILAVLNYGKAVQNYFGTGTSTWKFDGYTAQEIAQYASKDAPNQMTENGFTWVGANALFEENYEMQYYFSLDASITQIPDKIAALVVRDSSGKIIGRHSVEVTTVEITINDVKTEVYSVMYPVPASDLAEKDTTVQLILTFDNGKRVLDSPVYKYGIYAHLTYSVYHFTQELDAEKNHYFVSSDVGDGKKTEQYVHMLVSLLKLGEAVQRIQDTANQ